MHEHLQRLSRIWVEHPIYFVTTCTNDREPRLACEVASSVLEHEWRDAQLRHGWAIGRFVVMPDHVHFFCAPGHDSKPLSDFMKLWKEWTSKKINKALGLTNSLWQEEFFDHLLRSNESYSAKWDYVRNNPVRAGFVLNADDWPWQGEIERLQFD